MSRGSLLYLMNRECLPRTLEYFAEQAKKCHYPQAQSELESFDQGLLTGSIAPPLLNSTLTRLLFFAMSSERCDLVGLLLGMLNGAKILNDGHVLLLDYKFHALASFADAVLRHVRIDKETVSAMASPKLVDHALPYLAGAINEEVTETLSLRRLDLPATAGIASYRVEGEQWARRMLQYNCFTGNSPAYQELIRQHPEMISAEVVRIVRSCEHVDGHVCWYWQLVATPEERDELLNSVNHLRNVVAVAICEPGARLQVGVTYQRCELEELLLLPEDVAYRCLVVLPKLEPLDAPIWRDPSPILSRLLRRSCYSGDRVADVWYRSLFP